MCQLPRGSECIRDIPISSLNIEINEGLFFVPCNRSDENIMFYINDRDYVIIHEDGIVHATGWTTPEQFNEIIRTRSALGWDGKE